MHVLCLICTDVWHALGVICRRWCASQVDRKLTQAIRTEIDHEAEIDEKKECPTLRDFEVTNNGMNVQLKRTLSREVITVRFLIQVNTHEEEVSSDSEEAASPVAAITSNFAGLKNMFASTETTEADDSVSDVIANRYFSVIIDKGSRGSLLFDCSWNEGRLRINHLAYFHESKLAHQVATHGDDENVGYEGPEVADLSDNLSSLWYEYLMSRGVNETMGAFMTTYSKFKEQKEYVDWLANTLKFVEE